MAALPYDEQVRALSPATAGQKAAMPLQTASQAIQRQEAGDQCATDVWTEYINERLREVGSDTNVFRIDFAVSPQGITLVDHQFLEGDRQSGLEISSPELLDFLEQRCRQVASGADFSVVSLRFQRHGVGWQLDHQEEVAHGSLIEPADATLADLEEADYVTDGASLADQIVDEVRDTRFMIVALAGELLAEQDPRRIENIAWTVVTYAGVPAVVRTAARFRGPAARSFDWGHIFDRHWEFGDVARQRIAAGRTEGIFTGLTQAQIRARVRSAWRNRERMETQIVDGDVRIRYRGIDPQSQETVEFWYHQETRTVATAYPIGER